MLTRNAKQPDGKLTRELVRGHLDGAIQDLDAAGAVQTGVGVTELETSSGSDVAITLANGEEGQEKVIYLKTKGSTGNFVLTPTNLLGYTTITFNTVGDAVLLKFLNGKWVVLSNQGAALA